jgi:general secretion pathway protein A
VYTEFFRFSELPFSIAPDPAFFYMSQKHQEALGHLLFGTGKYGGFVQLTGEVGTGKTTVIRALLDQKLDNVRVVFIHNPRQSEQEFVQTLCDELGIAYPEHFTLKTLTDALNQNLLKTHAQGLRTVLIIDEAQQLKPEVLEQIRLLTNLETHKEKLLRIMLVGQPELVVLLARQDLRQLAQRITARFDLQPLSPEEVAEYLKHRLETVGGDPNLFQPEAVRLLQKQSKGIPRLVNVLADRALLAAYVAGVKYVSSSHVQAAVAEVLGQAPAPSWWSKITLPALPALPTLPALPALPSLPALPRLPRPSSTTVLMTLVPMVLGLLYYLLVLRAPSKPALPVQPALTSAAPQATTAEAAKPLEPPKPADKVADKPADKPTEKPAIKIAPSLPARTLSPVLNDLAGLWGSKITGGDKACRALHRARLECLKGQGDWQTLEKLNLPVILTLEAQDGQSRYVLLTGLNSQRLQLLGSDQDYTRDDLESEWTGEYLLLWRRETDEVEINRETRGEPVQWLRRKLAEADGGRSNNDPIFDNGLADKVRAFQKRRGLRVTGIADARTLALLAQVPPTARFPALRRT